MNSRIRWSRVSTISVTLACVVGFPVAGCSDEDGPGPAPVTPPAADSGTPPAQAGTLDLHVTDVDLSSPDGTITPPLANASVVLYPPGGAPMMEATSGADGAVGFKGIDWSQGTGTLVAYAPGRGALVLTDLDPTLIPKLPKTTAYDGLTVGLASYASNIAPTAALTGMVLNKADPAHYATIGATAGAAFYQDRTASYSLSVPAGKAFTLVATEWKLETAPAIQSFIKWVKIDVPANTATLDVDFATATALTSKKVKRTFVVPGGASGPLGGTNGYIQVTLPQTSAPLGYATSQVASTDGASVAVEAEVIPDFPGSVVTYNTLQKSDGSVSYVIEDGAPSDGTTVDGFLAPPAITFDSVRFGDPLALSGLVENERAVAYFTAVNGDVMIVAASMSTLIGATANALTLTPPRTATLPMALRTQLGTTALTGYFICTLPDDQLPVSKLGKHYAYSRQFNSAF